MSKTKLRLTFDIEYDLNGAKPQDMADRLLDLAQYGIDNGMITGSSEAEVADYKYTVAVVPEPLSEKELADFMLARIEGGTLDLGDIPVRLARYGLMEPIDFLNEMRERMEIADDDVTEGVGENRTEPRKVEDIVPGNLVDLTSCPFLSGHPTADSLYATVEGVNRETDDCIAITFQDIDTVGYPVGTVLKVKTPRDVPDMEINVHPLGKPNDWEVWHITPNLTDRWGDLNHAEADRKPIELLAQNEPILNRLISQMWDEITFVVRKDGQFGILYEVEFCSKESEEGQPDQPANLKPHAEMVKIILDGLTKLAKKFPGVEFAVPDETAVINDRPAAWAFVKDGLLDDRQREQLGMALLEL